ncbi:MAG: glutamate--tRNA ligase [Chitinophagaceae bacterium]
MQKVRTRFAPSPTGGLHLGGVRTALYSYLLAKKQGGDFVLRIEDTDQNRYVEGAEQYIIDSLAWCGIIPDEGPHIGGQYGPYRQSERKNLYTQYAMQLVKSGHAYYAFDTTEDLEKMRQGAYEHSNQYDHHTRRHMKNSLTLSEDETQKLLAEKTPFVIRLLVPENEIISFYDEIRGDIQNNSNLLDDKVLLKADAMPTYHLAVVVDDYLMKITHALRGEEWLPSAPIHVLLWKYLGWEHAMPKWAHLPLILKPDGNGKLSKRDGERLGFPVFTLNWLDPNTEHQYFGFKEMGFMPEAFVNMLAMFGWHSGEEQELFSMQELIDKFSLERIHKSGAKFDFEKAKWFNQAWIHQSDSDALMPYVKEILSQKNITPTDEKSLLHIISLVKDRCVLLNDFYTQCYYFFRAPHQLAIQHVKPKWTEEKNQFFKSWSGALDHIESWQVESIETNFKQLAEQLQIKAGELQMPLRIMLVGDKYGPNVFQIAHSIGKEELQKRIQTFLNAL